MALTAAMIHRAVQGPDSAGAFTILPEGYPATLTTGAQCMAVTVTGPGALVQLGAALAAELVAAVAGNPRTVVGGALKLLRPRVVTAGDDVVAYWPHIRWEAAP